MNSRSLMVEKIKKIPQFKPREWQNGLETRKKDEIVLHNELRDPYKKEHFDQEADNQKFYSITESSKFYIEEILKNIAKGNIILDYACGNGKMAILGAQNEAFFSVGIDISDISIKNAQESVTKLPVQIANRIHFFQGDCESTGLPDSSIDVVICSGMLHHLNLKKAYTELFRIISPGGTLIGIEALGHNPFFQAYRFFTPHLRTAWEKNHIMRISDIHRATKFEFKIKEVKYWHLFELFAVPFRKSKRFSSIQKIGRKIDKLLFRIPFFSRLAWQVSFILQKNA